MKYLLLYWRRIFSLTIIICFTVFILFISNFAKQDTENPCFFCHADLVYETKEGIHTKNSIDCIACHGISMEHTFTEDNSKKPEKIYQKSDISDFCGNCHNDELEDFQKSIHYIGVNQKNKNYPTCSTCHEKHRFENKKNIMKNCLVCHDSNSNESKSIVKISEKKLNLYQIHSLIKLEKTK